MGSKRRKITNYEQWQGNSEPQTVFHSKAADIIGKLFAELDVKLCWVNRNSLKKG